MLRLVRKTARPVFFWAAWCLVFLWAGPVTAAAPEPMEVPQDLPQAQRQELNRQRGELALRWQGLVERVKAHNEHCFGVKSGSPQGERCAANLAAIRRAIGQYIAAVERFNIRVAAAQIRRERAAGPEKPAARPKSSP